MGGSPIYLWRPREAPLSCTPDAGQGLNVTIGVSMPSNQSASSSEFPQAHYNHGPAWYASAATGCLFDPPPEMLAVDVNELGVNRVTLVATPKRSPRYTITAGEWVSRT